MAEEKQQYEKLPGRGRKRGPISLFIRTSAALWKGSDHLLSVISSGYSEEYKRFYYRDIQAFVITKDSRFMVSNVFLVLGLMFISLLHLLFLSGVDNTVIAHIAFAPLEVILLVALVVHLMRGPTCTFVLKTAVSQEDLPSLTRIKRAEHVMQILRPYLQRAQGSLTRQDVEQLEVPQQPAPEPEPRRELAQTTTAFGPATAPPSAQSRPEVPYKGQVHLALFIVLVCYTMVMALSLSISSLSVYILDFFTWIVLGTLTVAALVKQQNSSISKSMKSATWAALGFVLLSIAIGFVETMIVAIKDPERANNSWELLKTYAEMSKTDNPFFLYSGILMILYSLVLGLLGLHSFSQYRRTPTAPRSRPVNGE